MASLFFFSPVLRAADMHERIQTATQILEQKQGSDEPIPADLLDHAKGVAIFSLTKAGLGIGGQGGEGIVLLRLGQKAVSTWSAPSAFNLGGGSLGAQIGFTEVRYIVVLNTDDAVRHFKPGEGQLECNGHGNCWFRYWNGKSFNVRSQTPGGSRLQRLGWHFWWGNFGGHLRRAQGCH